MIQLEFEGLWRRFGKRIVLRNVGAVVEQGQALVVTGANGSGKSTLLQLLAGLQVADRGRVSYRINARELNRHEMQCELGLVAPDVVLYPELSAHENLHFFASVRGLPWSEESSRTALSGVGLDGRMHDPAGSFSSGMRVRLKYAVALQTQPRFLLLDEPTAMLDEEGAAFVEGVIDIQRRRGLLVLATNDPREVRHGDLQIHLG